MGYCYDNRGRLACDNCSATRGVKKNICPETVLTDSLRTTRPGLRLEIPYCYPPALCARCEEKLADTIHAPCKEHAAASQATSDAVEALLEDGAYLRTAAWGDWHAHVPEGRVGVSFRNLRGQAAYYHVDPTEYRAFTQIARPQDYPSATPMTPIR